MSPAIAQRAYTTEPHDLAIAVTASLFAAISFAFPNTGELRLFAASIPRGWVMGSVFVSFAAASVLAGFLPPSNQRKFFAFIRLFYPQAFLVLFFTESIMLSSQVFDGFSHDAAFAAADQWIFGFQPAREFHKLFESKAFVNELMYGAYFIYFVLLIVTPWLSWLQGRAEEARRLLFISVVAMVSLSIFYIFFRVQGPKYWFEDLHSAWYENIPGGIFVAFFQRLFSTAVLSGAAFPSTHVAMTAVTVYIAGKTDRRLIAPYAIVSLFILASTVYIYAHYFVDIIGGLAYAAVAVPLLSRIYPFVLKIASRVGTNGDKNRMRTTA